MAQHSLQIQSVLYCNKKESLLKALRSLQRAIQLNKQTTEELGDVCVCYGDASPEAIFTSEEIVELNNEFNDSFLLKYEFFNENTGSAKGHNRLGEKCESEYMLIMNPDVVVCPRVFHIMLKPFMDPTLKCGMTEARQTPVEHPKDYDEKTYETGWATTAFAIFSTEVFRELNGFDADMFFMYCDDLDFSWRVRMLGKKIYYLPDAIVFHAKTLSAKASWKPTSAEVYYSAEAAILMAYKWSNDQRCSKLRDDFITSGDDNLVRAAKHFDELKKSGKLPVQLDPKHKVAEFVGDYYTKHRFKL